MSREAEFSGRRCFIGLFGLNRSARWTSPSIHRNVIAPLKSTGLECFVAAHFNQPEVIDHPISGEPRVRLRPTKTTDFEVDILWVEAQSEANIAELVDVALSVPFRDFDDPTGGTRRNILQQMHSLKRLYQLAGLVGRETFDLFVFLRPDLEYIDRADLDMIGKVVRGELDMVTPSWHQWGGMNDRFAFCNLRAAEVFMGRWDRIDAFCRARGYIHPETILAEAAAEAELKVEMTEQRALRVRATGETRAEGFHLGKVTRAIHRLRPVIQAIMPS